jgi:hypothetical protein
VERDDDWALDGMCFMSSNVLCGHSNVWFVDPCWLIRLQ